MKKAINIGIWGQFGDGKNIADGQAVKTLILYRELQNHYGESAVSIVNTNGWRRHPIGLPPIVVPKRELVNADFRHENLCYCLAVS